MRLSLLIIITLLLAVIATLLAIQTFKEPPQKPDPWTYMIIAPSDDELDQELDRDGAQGWEIAAARRATHGEGYSSTARYEIILKRRGAQSLPAKLPVPPNPK